MVPGNAKCLMLPVKSGLHYFKRISDWAYSSKIFLYFQLQNHEYFSLLYSMYYYIIFITPLVIIRDINLIFTCCNAFWDCNICKNTVAGDTL